MMTSSGSATVRKSLRGDPVKHLLWLEDEIAMKDVGPAVAKETESAWEARYLNQTYQTRNRANGKSWTSPGSHINAFP